MNATSLNGGEKISVRQDFPEVLRLLCGGQALFRMLSAWVAVTTAINLMLPIIAVTASAFAPGRFDPLLAYAAVIVAAVELWGEYRIEDGKGALAILLEHIDLLLLGALPAGENVPALGELDRLRILNGAERFKNVAAVKGWYPALLDRLNPTFAVLAVQVINSVYESYLRRAAGVLLLVLAGTVATVALSLGATLDLQIGRFVQTILLPLLPLVVSTARSGAKQLAAARTCSTLAAKARADFKLLSEGERSAREATRRVRDRQNALYSMRKGAPPVLELTYRRHRPFLESEMLFLVSELTGKTGPDVPSSPDVEPATP